jgi:hypothetical protein
MMDYSLPAEKLAELRAAHRRTRDKREADRIKAVVLLASGWRAEDVADALPYHYPHLSGARVTRGWTR